MALKQIFCGILLLHLTICKEIIKIDNCEIEPGVPIHWDLMGLNQTDEKLIQAIKNKVLWPPPNKDKKLKLNLPPSLQYIQGSRVFKNILQKFREINSLFFLQVKMDNL